MMTIDWNYYPEAHWSLAVLGVEAASKAEALSLNPHIVGHDAPWRVAVHEAAHALAGLLESIEWSEAELIPGGGGVVGHDIGQPAPLDYEMPPFGARVAFDISGPLGEEIVFGDAGALGGSVDAARVLARFDIRLDDVDPRCVHQARAHVTRARRMLREHRDLLITVATALLSAGRLTRSRCVEVLEQQHRTIFCPPAFRWLSPPDEHARVSEAYARLKARQDALRPEAAP